MTKIAIIVGGVVLMAGVALAGTLTSLGSAGTPAAQTINPPAATTNRVTLDDRRQENELRGRASEAGEDKRGREENEVRGRANEAREDQRGRENEPGDDRGNDAGDQSNRDSSGDDSSGHGGDGGGDD